MASECSLEQKVLIIIKWIMVKQGPKIGFNFDSHEGQHSCFWKKTKTNKTRKSYFNSVEKFPVVTNFHDVIKSSLDRKSLCFPFLLCLNLVFPSSRRFYLSLDTMTLTEVIDWSDSTLTKNNLSHCTENTPRIKHLLQIAKSEEMPQNLRKPTTFTL